MKPDQKKDLRDCITYFGNHLHQMRYARYVANGIPIGSGVTEAACKTLVKQRLGCSGMRSTPEGAQIILSPWALVTETRWEQFWQKINQYGVPHRPLFANGITARLPLRWPKRETAKIASFLPPFGPVDT
jgi:hypothetical protein